MIRDLFRWALAWAGLVPPQPLPREETPMTQAPISWHVAGAMYITMSGLVRACSTWNFDPRDPLAITVQFSDSEWRFARDLLRDGLDLAAGEGDVIVRRVSAGVELHLRRPHVEARIIFRHEDLTEFLHATERAVSFGSESVDVDELLRQALAGDRDV